MKDLNSSLTNKNKKWFSRDEAFSYLDVDLESQVRIKHIFNIFGNLINESRGNKLLDVGCADGRIGKQLIDLGYSVYGMDVSSVLIKKAKKKGIKTKLFDAADGLPYKDEVFDFVFAGEIIEHLLDTEFIIKEINRILKIGGYAVITTPNLVHLPDRMFFLKGCAPGQTQPLHVFLKYHIRQFTHGSWNNILHQFNFKVIDSRSSIVVFERDSKDINKVKKYSKFLADLFPSLGASVIVVSKKIKNCN